MEYDAVITYRATIVMQLLNTCTGRPLVNPKVQITCGSHNLSTVMKPNGFCVILDAGEEPMDIALQVAGFETQELTVSPTVHWERPMLSHLIPEVFQYGFQTHVTLEGTMEGITHLSGVYLSNYILRYKSYQSKTKKMAIFNRHNKP